MLLNKKGDFDGSIDWINVLIVALLIGLVVAAIYGVGIGIFRYILGVLFVIAGIFGIIDGWKIDNWGWKIPVMLAFIIVTTIGANLVFTLPYVGNYIVPAQEFYSIPGIISYLVISIIVVLLIIDIFMSEGY